MQPLRDQPLHANVRRMRERRRNSTRARGTLLPTELLLLAASGVVILVTYLAWTPCAGSMLEGTQFDPSPNEWASFTEACHAAMDHGDGFPVSGWLESPLQRTVNGLNAIALLLLGGAWLMLVRNWHPRGVLRLVLASLPGMLNLWLAGVAALAFVWPPAEAPAAASIAALLMDITWLVSVIALLADRDMPLSVVLATRVVLLALATTAASFGHLLVDYSVMINFSEANWDSPPGSGYLTAFSIALFAILSMLLGGLGRLERRRLVREPVAPG